MAAFLKTIVLLPIVILALLFAIANRAPVVVSLDPFSRAAPDLAFAVPLWAIVFGAIATGVVLGGMGAWLAASGHRRAGRLSRREAGRLRVEADRLRSAARTPAGLALPAPRG